MWLERYGFQSLMGASPSLYGLYVGTATPQQHMCNQLLVHDRLILRDGCTMWWHDKCLNFGSPDFKIGILHIISAIQIYGILIPRERTNWKWFFSRPAFVVHKNLMYSTSLIFKTIGLPLIDNGSCQFSKGSFCFERFSLLINFSSYFSLLKRKWLVKYSSKLAKLKWKFTYSKVAVLSMFKSSSVQSAPKVDQFICNGTLAHFETNQKFKMAADSKFWWFGDSSVETSWTCLV